MMSKTKTLKTFTLSSLMLAAMGFSSTLLAGDKENSIIDKAVIAYGGEELTQLKSLSLVDNQQHFSQWQSGHSAQGAMISYLNESQIELTVDLANKRKVFKRATSRLVGGHGSNRPSVTHRVFADEKGYAIDHALQQYHPSKRINYNNADIATSHLLDTLIIRQLNENRDASQWVDIAYIRGEAHDVLTIHAGSKDEYHIYLNQQTGHLSRVVRKRRGKLTSYDFLDHAQTQGVTWAKQVFVGTESQPIYLNQARQITFNSATDAQFEIPTNYQPRPKVQPVDVSKLTIRELAKGVYFVGQDWGYSVFIDVGEHYISAGSWQMDNSSQAWQKGLDLLRKTTGNNKPIKQHIVSHHHDDHMMGLADVVKQGAELVIHPADISSVQKHLPEPLEMSRFMPVTGTSYLADGKVMLFDVPNSHANHNLVIYLPESKILFSEDVFGSTYQKAFNSPAYWPDGEAYHRLEILVDKIKQQGLDVDLYLSSHHARVLTQAEIDQALTIARPEKEILLKRLFSSDRKNTKANQLFE